MSTVSVSSHASSLASRDDTSVPQITSFHCFNSHSLEKELRKFWESEELPQFVDLHPDDEKCDAHFWLTHSRNPDGHGSPAL